MNGKKFLLFWDAIRALVDKNIEKGQIILTGSSTSQIKGILHSGTGRIKSIRMNTMSLYMNLMIQVVMFL